MGRPGLKHYETGNLLRRISEVRAWGEWQDIDGGALRIRIYRGVGTAHLENNPEIYCRLNGVLASLYPIATANISEKARDTSIYKALASVITPR